MALNAIGLGFIFTSKEFVSKDLKGMSGGFGQLEKAIGKFAGTTRVQLRDARGRFAGIGTELSSTGKQILSGLKMAGVGMVAFKAGIRGLKAFGPAIADANEFGKAIGEVSTLVDEASFSTDRMRAITMEMAGEFGADAFVQAPALYQAISAGASDVDSATKLMTASNKLAIGGVTDLTTSVDVLSTATNVYSAAGLTAADASDTLFVAIRAGKTTAGELGASLGRVLPIANSLGLSFAEVNASVAAMTANGLQTSRAVTGLNAALANVIKPTKAAKKEAKRLGIDFTAAALRAKGLRGFLDEVTGSAKFNKDSLSKLFGSVEGLNAITSLTSSNSAKFRDVMRQMEERAGSTDVAFGKMSQGLGFQINRLNALKRNLKITVGEAVAPFVRIFVSGLTRIVQGFQSLPKPVQRAIILIAFLGSGVVALTGAIIGVRGALLILRPAFSKLAISMAPTLAALWPFVAAAAAVAAAFFLLKKAFDDNIGGFGDEMRAVWDDLRPAIEELKTAFADAFSALMDALRPLLPILASIARIVIKGLVLGVKLLAFQIRIMARIAKFVIRGVVVVVNVLAEVLRGVGKMAVAVGVQMVRVGSAIKRAWQLVADFLRPIAEFLLDIFNELKELISDVIDLARDAADMVGDVVDDVGGFLDDVTGNVVSGAVGDLTGSITSVVERKQIAASQQGGATPTPTSADLLAPIAGPSGAGPGRGRAPEKVTLVANIVMDGQRIEQRVTEIQAERSTRRTE